MSAFADTADRHRALRLIGYRAQAVTDDGAALGFLRNTEPDQFAGLLHGALQLFATLRPRLRNGLASGLMDLALSQIAAIDQSAYRRLAAELIVAYEKSGADDDGDHVFHDHGADDFNHCIDRMDCLGRHYEVVIAIADVWLQLLPELKSEDGMELLVKHATELDSD